MLTNITGFTNLEDNTQVTSDDLDLLYTNMVMPDVVNLQGKDMSKGFSSSAAKEITSKVESPVTSKVCILCDFSFNVYYELRKLGFEHSNIYIAFGKWETYKKGREEHARVAEDKNVFRIMKKIAVNSFKEFNEHPENIIELKDIFDMEFDLIISNPPYGTIGAVITKNIIDNVKFNEFVNLLPANDYTRAKGLVGHVDLNTLEPLGNVFKDATVLAWIAKLNKGSTNITKEMFTVRTYDERFQKFYMENAIRTHYAISKIIGGITTEATKEELELHLANLDINTCFMITARTAKDGVHKTSNCKDYHWNIAKDITSKDLHILYDKSLKKFEATYAFIEFTTAQEKSNFNKFWYEGKLMNALINHMSRTGGSTGPALPKVDWSRPWTDKEILIEFGYSDEEANAILETL